MRQEEGSQSWLTYRSSRVGLKSLEVEPVFVFCFFGVFLASKYLSSCAVDSLGWWRQLVALKALLMKGIKVGLPSQSGGPQSVTHIVS